MTTGAPFFFLTMVIMPSQWMIVAKQDGYDDGERQRQDEPDPISTAA